MPSVARLGDGSDHGGYIASVSQTSGKANGIQIAVQGDIHDCPISGHGNTAISSVISHTTIKGNLVLTVGAVAGCGAKINTGSPDVNAD